MAVLTSALSVFYAYAYACAYACVASEDRALPLRLLHKTKLGWLDYSVLLRRHRRPRGRKTST